MSRLPVDARGTASRLRSVEERTRASAAVGLALHPSPGLYHCGVGGVCLAELGAEERPGAAGDEPPQQLQRAGRNVPGVRTMAGGVRAICSVTGTVAVFSPAVWPGKRGRLKLLWHRRTWPFDRQRRQRDCGLRESLPIRRLLWKCAWRTGDFGFSTRTPLQGSTHSQPRRRRSHSAQGHEDFREASNRKWICSY